MNSKKHFHKFHSCLLFINPSSPRLRLSLLLPPLQCKRPWCLFEGLPRHISTANLACYTCATIAKSSSFIVMTHKARPKHKRLPVIEPLLDERNRVFILGEEKEWIHTDWPPLPPPICFDDQTLSRCIKQWSPGSHMRKKLLYRLWEINWCCLFIFNYLPFLGVFLHHPHAE